MASATIMGTEAKSPTLVHAIPLSTSAEFINPSRNHLLLMYSHRTTEKRFYHARYLLGCARVRMALAWTIGPQRRSS